MLTEDLFDKILIDPMYSHGVDHLCVHTGSASSAFCRYHIERLADLEKSVTIEVIIGMTPVTGISSDEHENFKFLANSKEYPKINFKCSYVRSQNPVNANIYVWLKHKLPKVGFIGSANYKFAAFYEGQREAMQYAEAAEVRKVFRRLSDDIVNCSARRIEDDTRIFDTLSLTEQKASLNKPGGQFYSIPILPNEFDKTRKGEAGELGGLFQESGKAVFRLPEELAVTNFFPSDSKRFVLIADDGWENTMVVRNKKGSRVMQVATSKNLFVNYLKARLGLQPHNTVTYGHLRQYERSKVEITKADGFYYLDFAPGSRRRGTSGIHSIVEGQYYDSYGAGGQAFNCAFGTFGSMVNAQQADPRSDVFCRFLSSRMSEHNIDNFKQSNHYKNVLKRYKQYPPPRKVKKLIFIGKPELEDLN